MGYAFISYSTKNRLCADAVRNIFRTQGIDTWMAPYDIPAGSKYAAVITKAIRECSCFILLLSNDAQASDAVDSEVELAVLTYKKPVITLELEKVELNDSFTFYLHNKHIVAVPVINEDSQPMKQVMLAVSAHTKDFEYRRTPTILQKHATGCGAAALSMIFSYYGLKLSLDQMIIETCTTDQGCNFGDLKRAAEKYGFTCKGYRKTAQELMNVKCPCILHWHNNHIVVLDGIKDGYAYINDPIMGRRKMTMSELHMLFSGTVLTFSAPYSRGTSE